MSAPWLNESVIWQLLFVSILCVFKLFESCVENEIQIESRLHCIDKYEDDWKYLIDCFIFTEILNQWRKKTFVELRSAPVFVCNK